MKIKRIICALLLVAVLLGTSNLGGMTANAETYDPADLCLLDAIDLMIDEEVETLNFSRQELFDYELEPIGYGYELRLNGKIGFALMIMRTYYYEVTELYLYKALPFAGIDGVPVYMTPLCYVEYSDGQYRDIEAGVTLDDEQLLSVRERGFGYKEEEVGYQGGDYYGTIVQSSVTYDSRTEDGVRIEGAVPTYFDTNPNLSGTCAVQAGAVALGYYARYFPELVPGFTVGMQIGPAYIYLNGSNSPAVQDVINDLYDRMETNVGGGGTTAAGFRNGLEDYVEAKGRNLGYTSIASNNTLNYDLFKTQVNNLRPSVLFFNTYNATKPPAVRTVGNTDKIDMKAYPGLHVMIGYGCKKYTYYKNGSDFKTDYYIEAYTGVLECAQGYVKLYDHSILVEGYAINIY